MPAPIEMNCPDCEEPLRIPSAVFGKKIKCKHCGHAFVVQDPDSKRTAKSAKPLKPTKSGVKKPESAPSPPPPEAKKPLWEDDDGIDIEVVHEEDVPRCPHCAKELDPPEAIVCIHCGFNSRTRAKAETKKVWAPDAMDWFMHLLPGIIALSIVIGMIVLNIYCLVNMRDWMKGSFLESEEKDAIGRNKMYVPPGAFICFIMVGSLPIVIPSVKYAFKRLAIDYRPVDQVKK